MGIVAYVVAGIFLYSLNLLLLFRFPGVSDSSKYSFAGVFLISVVIAVFVGVACRGTTRWRRDISTLLTSVAAFDAFIALSLFCMFASPEAQDLIPAKLKGTMSDYWPAGICLFVYLALGGVLLLWDKSIRKQMER